MEGRPEIQPEPYYPPTYVPEPAQKRPWFGWTAREYAERVMEGTDGDLARIIGRLSQYDAAVASQAAHLYHTQGGDLQAPVARGALGSGSPATQAGFRRYLEAWRDSEIARSVD